MDGNVVWRLKAGVKMAVQCLFLFNSLHKFLICYKPHIQIEILQCRDPPKVVMNISVLKKKREKNSHKRRKWLPESLKWDSGLCWILVL